MNSLFSMMGGMQNPYQTQMFGNMPFSVLPQIPRVNQPMPQQPQQPQQPPMHGGGGGLGGVPGSFIQAVRQARGMPYNMFSGEAGAQNRAMLQSGQAPSPSMVQEWNQGRKPSYNPQANFGVQQARMAWGQGQ